MPQFDKLIRELTIIDKDAQTQAFPLDTPFAWAQREVLGVVQDKWDAGEPVRLIVLKARQLGISTLTEGLLFWWMFAKPGAGGLVVAHDAETTSTLFEKTQMFWETWPYKELWKVRHSTQRRLTWDAIHSSIRVATAKNLQSGRGRTLHAVHLSECAFYDDPETLMAGLSKSVPNKAGTIIVLESTANGAAGWFFDEWQHAKQGESDYIPLFFPWWKHPEYSIPGARIDRDDITEEEQELLHLGVDDEHLGWRRWAIPNLCHHSLDEFHQEFPSTDIEAFVTTGNPVFAVSDLDACYEPQQGYRGILIDRGGVMEFVSDPRGPLTVFQAPATSDRADLYFVAGDPSFTTYGDPACIQVINRWTAEQVAVWHGQCDPIHFAGEMMKLGFWYNQAMLCPEVSYAGQATIATLIAKGYPSLWEHRWADKSQGKRSSSMGWEMSWKRKDWCIGHLQFLFGQGKQHGPRHHILVHDEKTYWQLRGFVTHEGGYMSNVTKKTHDDAVMALAIAYTASQTEGPYRIETTPMGFNESMEMFERQGVL